ncbi:MAG: prepilin-type N-terminal cleavage/methylation domain-containing protein [Syntrophales bacterium]|nr:prepilin-type N-terminal cleavage/methylation domain-containing protein [Syntrophales bacterium]
MNATCRKLLRTVKNRDGFTLIEMLIVIIILGILAMVIIPQITVSTDDAKVSTLKTNLAGMRSAIEMYYAQHNMTYPGINKTTGNTVAAPVLSAAGDVVEAFTKQMTQYTDAAGNVSVSPSTSFPLGPYIKGGALPANPFNNLNTLASDFTVVDITAARAADATATGWKFLPKLGIFFANDGGTSSSVAHTTY